MKFSKRFSSVFLICLGQAIFSPYSQGDTYALLMGIGNYQNPLNNLPGIDKDLEHARDIAHRLGVSDTHVTELSNQQLSLSGMQQAFTKLRQSVSDDDAVFIYYSGHGSRQRVGQSCSEALVAYDQKLFSDKDLEAQLQLLAKKTRKLVVLLDSCFSGGATQAPTRTYSLEDLDNDADLAVPKYIPGEDCSKPVNLTRDYNALKNHWGQALNNYIHIAAARDNEVSFAGGKGSWATVAWHECLETGVSDSDGSGGISAEEIQRCAQEQLDRKPSTEKKQPHHITLIGNTRTVLDLQKNPTPATSPAPPDAKAALLDIYNSRDGRRRVDITLEQNHLRIGEDWLKFNVHSAEAGYVYVLMVGSDGTTFNLLFPNDLDSNNRINAGQTLALPRPNWQLRVAGPAGEDKLLVLVTPQARDFTHLSASPAGPFKNIIVTQESTIDMQALVGSLNQKCAGAACTYGAALISAYEN